MTNPLRQLLDHGQSVWLDFVSRPLLESGELARLIEADGIRGVTSNPSIFEKAIGQSSDYDADLARLVAEGDRPVEALFEALAIADIRRAADALRGVYDATTGADGFISLEVSPYLAMDTAGTIAEARALWRAVDRPNLMIKVPGTAPGVPAVRTLIAEGINVNVTLLFSIDAYEAVAEAYIDGLAACGGPIARVASVASFFVSRIDQSVEAIVARRLPGATEEEAAALRGLAGKVAIANAKLAYRHYQGLIASPRWQALATRGARPQRLLWASTGTKSKDFPDTLYVDTLIGPDTVNTMPPATLAAVRDHGGVATTLTTGLDEAEAVVTALGRLGISLSAITAELVQDGVRRFAEDADKLFAAVARRRAEAVGAVPMRLAPPVPGLAEAQEAWRKAGDVRRLWARDAALWTGGDEARWLGWLDAPFPPAALTQRLAGFATGVAAEGITHVLLIGMGGSSLGAEVLATVLPAQRRLVVLDSTDPAQIRAAEAGIDPARTLVLVASKSGGTLEPDLLMRHFLTRVPPGRFVAVTDPGSALEAFARREGFRDVFLGDPAIGGRYSVLSVFGLVPAAAIGLDVAALLAGAARMAHGCGAMVPPAENPGVQLGLAMALATRGGRDKLTIVASRGLAAIGAWLEQLVAESTGKQGRGIIPIADEPPVAPERYGADRLFVHLALAGEADAARAARIEGLRQSGHPVIELTQSGPEAIGGEFFRWEIATAVAGAMLGIHPFDQPDVEASKVKTRTLTEAIEAGGAVPAEKPLLRAGALTLYADPANAAALGHPATLTDALRAHFARLAAGDYAALLAYIARSGPHEAALRRLRERILAARGVATAAGFGPRFLHSTGQAYKGGPNSGVFVQITGSAPDLPVPGRRIGFAAVLAAQARGDFEVLAERGRRAVRVDLGTDIEAGLAALDAALAAALA